MSLLSPEQEAQLRSLKAHFPFRYCFAAIHPQTGDFQTWARSTYPGRKMRALSARGYLLLELDTTVNNQPTQKP